jgi:hypothetical protein
MTTRVFEPGKQASPATLDGYLALAAAVLAKAAQEARAGDLGACEFLEGPEGALYLDALGLNPETVKPLARTWASDPGGRLTIRLYALEV